MTPRVVCCGLAVAAVVSLNTGCRSSGNPDVVFSPLPGPSATVSDRRDVRIYPGHIPTSNSQTQNPQDLAIAAKINDILRSDDPGSGTSFNTIRAVVHDGVVTLQGTVPTDNLRQEIERRTSIISGVQRVRNELVVELK